MLTGSTLTGPLRITGASALRICGSTVAGPVTVTGSTGPVPIGDGADPLTGCSGHRVMGLVSATTSGGILRLDATSAQPVSDPAPPAPAPDSGMTGLTHP